MQTYLLPALLTFCLCSGDAKHELSFKAIDAQSMQVEARFESEMKSGELKVVMDGGEVPSMFLPQLEITITSVIELSARERYVKVEDGTPRKLLRHYETFEGAGRLELDMEPGESQEQEWSREAEVESQEVEFEWNAEEARFERRLVESAERPDELAQLDARLDLARLLPPTAVQVGDSWELEGAALESLLLPGGDLGLADDAAAIASPYERTESTHAVEARLVKLLEIDGERLALIAIEGNATTKEQRATTLEYVPVAEGTAIEYATRRAEFEGELLWNLAEHHAASLELSVQFDHLTKTVKDEGQPGPSYSSTLDFNGEESVTISFEALD